MNEDKEMNQAITESQEYAVSLRGKGYSCSQCVLMALSGYLGLDEKLAARISAAYGTGFGGSGLMCGAMSILGVAEGMLTKGEEPVEKIDAMKRTRTLLDRFKEINDGRFLCKDLKTKEPVRKCPDLIKEGVEIFLRQHPELV